jgi:hypothetical protein
MPRIVFQRALCVCVCCCCLFHPHCRSYRMDRCRAQEFGLNTMKKGVNQPTNQPTKSDLVCFNMVLTELPCRSTTQVETLPLTKTDQGQQAFFASLSGNRCVVFWNEMATSGEASISSLHCCWSILKTHVKYHEILL